MAMSAEHSSKFKALHRQWYEWKILEWEEQPDVNKKKADRVYLFKFLNFYGFFSLIFYEVVSRWFTLLII